MYICISSGSKFGRVGRRAGPTRRRWICIQASDGLELPFDIPQDGGLGVPIRESVAQVGKIAREEVSHALIRDQIA